MEQDGGPSLEDIGGNGRMQGDLFLTREILQRVELVRHLLENTAIVPLLTGPKGSGKSTLVDFIDEHAPKHWLVLDVDAETAADPEALMASLGEQLGLGANVRDMDTLTQRLDGVVRQSRVPVVLTDDAQNLTSETLSMLLALAEGSVAGRPLLKIVLFADDDLDHLLKLPKFEPIARTRFQRMEMPRFSFGQARAFVAARYANAGRALPAGLGFEKLYAVSGGWPGELIQRADTYLKPGAARKNAVPSARSRKRWWLLLAAVVVVALVAGLLWFQQDINRFVAGTQADVSSAPPDRPDIKPIEAESPEPLPMPTSRTAPEGDELVPPDVIENDRVAASDESSSQAPLEAPRDIVDILLEEGPVDSDSADDDQASVAKAVENPEAVAKERSEARTAGVDPEAATTAAKQAPAKDKQDKVRDTASPVGQSRHTRKPAVPPAGKHAPIMSLEAKPRDIPVATPKPVAQTDAEWLVGAPPRDYTLQLMGAYSRPDLKRFARRIGIDANSLHVVRVARDGKPWYVVLHGRYANASAAKKALSRLPAKARRLGPWARRFASFRPMVD